MASCRTNHTFENWARTLKFKPDLYCQPESQAELVDIVKKASAAGGRVRMAGGGHSWSHFVVTDRTLVQLDELDKALVADVPNRRYTVEAGIRIKNLIKNLRSVGLGMRNLGSITEQSIAGAIATGTHGTGLGIGNMSTAIVGMKLVTGTGDVLTIGENDDLIHAARVSLGALGIVTEVTVQCVPNYDLEYSAYLSKFDDVVDKMDTLNEENERFLLWWLVTPIGPKDNVIVVTMNPPGTPPGILGPAGSPAGDGGGDGLPMDTNDLASLVMSFLPSGTFQRILHYTAPYHEVLTIPLLPVLHREFEYAIPVEHTTDVLKRLRQIFVEGDISTTLPVEVRFVAKDQSLLSPARGKDVCYIGVSTQPNANEVYARVEPLMKEVGGRPHWGKHFSLTRAEVEAMYPDSFDEFRNIRKDLDPKGVFTNTLIHHLFD